MVIGIIVSLLLLTYIAYRGLSVILFAPVCALLAASTAGLPLLPSYSELFMVKAVTYTKNFFPVFLLGAVFGKVMEESGAARSIAKFITLKLGHSRAPLAVAVSTAILTYGGVSMFVVPFAVYPFALTMFRDAGYPRRLIPGCIAIGSFGFSMTALPGSPQIQNMIPAKYFGTTLYSSPLFGICGAIIIFGASMLWIEHRKRKMLKAGEGFGREDERQSSQISEDAKNDPNPILCMIPLLAVLVLNYVFTKIMGTWDQGIMEGTKMLPLASATIPVANWALITALIVGIILAIVLCYRQFKMRKNLMLALNTGTIGSLLAIMNTSSEVGFGNIVSSLPGFGVVRDFLMGINPGTPLVSEAIMVNVLAGITGSASGGMSIALEAMGQHFVEWANEAGISIELLHRVAAMSSGGFDSLPHNGAVITMLAICGLTHKESYPDVGMVSVVIPFATCFLMILIWTVLGIKS